jgi:hypothetical protein
MHSTYGHALPVLPRSGGDRAPRRPVCHGPPSAQSGSAMGFSPAIGRRQSARRADSLSHADCGCHTLIVGADPRADSLTRVPRGVIPDEQQGGEALFRQAVAAPGQKVGRHGADGAPGHKPEQHLLGLRQQAAYQQPITCQCVRIGIALGTRQFLEAGDRLGLPPTMLAGLCQAAPPDFIGKAKRPRRMLSGQPDQAVAPFCFLR